MGTAWDFRMFPLSGSVCIQCEEQGLPRDVRCGKNTKDAFARQKCMIPFYCVELFWGGLWLQLLHFPALLAFGEGHGTSSHHGL